VIPAGPHGGDGARLAAVLGITADEVLDLSASLNPVAPDPGPLVARHAGAVRRYPDPAKATEALAAAMGVEADRLLLTNGGAEAIALVASEKPCGQVEDPEFSLYRRHLREVRPGAPRWRSNPHNPTGRLAAAGEKAAVWDEAFFPLATGTWTRGDADNGSFVVGSLTKLFACPGLRIGYVLCPDPASASLLAARQPRWSVNGPALAAMPELLAGADLGAWAAAVCGLREELVSLLRRHGFDPAQSQANWVLVHAPGLRGRLARSAILVRDCSSFGMPGTVRIAVPGAEGLERLDTALGSLAPAGEPA
jgi:histidinol-phosphate/aromatic aminotransferase/cobyric acid decarboxylase-like protein